jgi:hypothetical protein
MEKSNLVLLSRKDGKALETQTNSLSEGRTGFDQFKISWARLCAAFPRQELPAATVVVYYEMLSEFDEDAIKGAVDSCIRELKFFPSVAELRECMRGCMATARVWGKKLNAPDDDLCASSLEEIEEGESKRLGRFSGLIAELERKRN